MNVPLAIALLALIVGLCCLALAWASPWWWLESAFDALGRVFIAGGAVLVLVGIAVAVLWPSADVR